MNTIWIILLIILGFLLTMRFIIIPYYSRRPTNLGIRDKKFAPCPTTDNCVCTLEGEQIHQIDPIVYTGAIELAKKKIKHAIHAYGRAKIVTETSDYLYTEFRSLLWGFVDDVEFYFDDFNKVIHFRSASRVGTKDYGENRKRMERIRSSFLSQ